MDLITLRANTRTRLGVPDVDPLFTDTVLNQLVNEALHAIETEGDWPWLEAEETINTISGTDNYALAANWLRTEAVLPADYAPLELVEHPRLRAMPSSAGRPFFYAIGGDRLRLRPVPNSAIALTHIYVRQEPDLTTDSQVPLMPASYHFAIVQRAAYLGFRRTGQLDEAGGARADYEDWRRRMEERPDRNRETETPEKP